MPTRSTSFILSNEMVLDQPMPLQPITPTLILSLGEINVLPTPADESKTLPAMAAPACLINFLLCIVLQFFCLSPPDHNTAAIRFEGMLFILLRQEEGLCGV